MMKTIIEYVRKLIGLVYLLINRDNVVKEPIAFDGIIQKYKIKPIEVTSISYASQVSDINKCPACLPDIKIHVYGGEQQKRLRWQLVTLKLSNDNTHYLTGKLNKITNRRGEVVFSGLKVNCTGKYELIAMSGGKEAKSATFYVGLPNENKSITIDENDNKNFKETYDVIKKLNGYPGVLNILSTNVEGETLSVVKEKTDILCPEQICCDMSKIKRIGEELCTTLIYCNKEGVYCSSIHPKNIYVCNEHYKLDILAEERKDKESEGKLISSLGYLLYYCYADKAERSFETEKLNRDIQNSTDNSELMGIIRKACTFSDEQKYKTLFEMQTELKSINDKQKHIRKEYKVSVLVLILVCMLGFGAYYYDSQSGWSEWTFDRLSEVDRQGFIEQSRTVYRWWAAQCVNCGTNNPHWGKDYRCNGCGTKLAGEQNLWKSVFQYSEDIGEEHTVYNRDGARLFDGLPYWGRIIKVEYRYKEKR